MGGSEAKVARAPELVVWQEDQGLAGQWVTIPAALSCVHPTEKGTWDRDTDGVS